MRIEKTLENGTLTLTLDGFPEVITHGSQHANAIAEALNAANANPFVSRIMIERGSVPYIAPEAYTYYGDIPDEVIAEAKRKEREREARDAKDGVVWEHLDGIRLEEEEPKRMDTSDHLLGGENGVRIMRSLAQLNAPVDRSVINGEIVDESRSDGEESS